MTKIKVKVTVELELESVLMNSDQIMKEFIEETTYTFYNTDNVKVINEELTEIETIE